MRAALCGLVRQVLAAPPSARLHAFAELQKRMRTNRQPEHTALVDSVTTCDVFGLQDIVM